MNGERQCLLYKWKALQYFHFSFEPRKLSGTQIHFPLIVQSLNLVAIYNNPQSIRHAKCSLKRLARISIDGAILTIL